MHLKGVEAVLRGARRAPAQPQADRGRGGESGSVHFEEIVYTEQERLRADILVVSDTSIVAPGIPSLCTGLRGLAVSRCTSRGRRSICTRVASAALSPIPSRRFRRSWPRCTTRSPGGSPSPASTTMSANPRPRSASSSPASRTAVDEFRAEAGDVPATVSEAGWTDRERLWARPTPRVQWDLGRLLGPGPERRSSRPPPAPRSPAGWSPTRIPSEIADLVREAVLCCCAGRRYP